MNENYLGFYFGRFQPFSVKHLEIVQKILFENPKIKLSVGVADWTGDLDRNNFLKGWEAANIVKFSLEDFNLADRVSVLEVKLPPDLTLEQSISAFLNNFPKDNISVFSGSEKTLNALHLLKLQKYPFLEIVDLKDDDITPPRSREIRDSLLKGTDDWQSMVTSSVVEYLYSFQERLRLLPEGQEKRLWRSELEEEFNHLGLERR